MLTRQACNNVFSNAIIFIKQIAFAYDRLPRVSVCADELESTDEHRFCCEFFHSRASRFVVVSSYSRTPVEKARKEKKRAKHKINFDAIREEEEKETRKQFSVLQQQTQDGIHELLLWHRPSIGRRMRKKLHSLSIKKVSQMVAQYAMKTE
jgi:predicted XRE-type DNA-binding protein